MGAIHAAHALAWAMALALLSGQAMAAADTAASAPWPGVSRNQKYMLPARPSGEDWGAPRSPVAQSALALSYTALAAAEAPSSSPKFRLPPRPPSWANFSEGLKELQAGGQAQPAPSHADAEAPGSELIPALSPGFAQPPGMARSRAEASAAGFVATSGPNFVVDGKIKIFSGTNAHFLLSRCSSVQSCTLHHLKLERCIAEQWLHISCRPALYEQCGSRRRNLTNDGVVSYFKVRGRSAWQGSQLSTADV